MSAPVLWGTVAITGSRTWDNESLMRGVLQGVAFSKIVMGDARGADEMALRLACLWGRKYQVFHADWRELGKAAGPIRNRTMLDTAKPDLLIAFRRGWSSKGTDGCIKEARSRNIPVLICQAPQ